MSTLATADLGPSDDEADTDFVLPTKQPRAKKTKKRARKAGGDSDGSDLDSDDSDSDDDDGEEDTDEIKRLKAEAAEAEAAERKRRAAEAFRLMQEEAKGGGSSSSASPAPAAEKKEVEMVEVRIPRRFAGETVFETVMRPKDHPDAKKYGAVTETPSASASASANGAGAGTNGAAPTNPSSAPTEKDTTPSAPTAPGPPLRRPVRKRPRQSLEAMAAAIDAGKKITTLEKSQMDWNSHMSKETKLADEVAQHRRSGGFLEKQAFLDRVGERREAMGESSKGRRR